mmetsp:Transcript_5403/g.8525  ORF Transcript_5403/g.8525 Transcript_5403/m.8525 type:complete len:447 (+) Transcript_5403:3-1343(+)|eukprot:CAMPEP_0178752594 /NCGR_PEP_ID=MMETSP0744-20121128/11146_1 /TAXON_ID=913974 /ORGANISM="Nitzschia punctata, Strain CCMP561" /LENGTH=446 /DNA_ID=CAMNT_0020406323 /DNA_START=26 /DNA_END=1366 /DNA_ORIENTATION=+
MTDTSTTLEYTYTYTSVDGNKTRPSHVVTIDQIAKIAAIFVLLSVAFLAGRFTQPHHSSPSPAFTTDPATFASGTIPLPQDFEKAKLKVAVSDDGKTFLVALPAKTRYGVHAMSQQPELDSSGNTAWKSTLIRDGFRSIRTLHLTNDASVATYWADYELMGHNIPYKKPSFGQYPFPEDIVEKLDLYEMFPNIAINDDASRILMLTLTPDLTFQLYSRDAQGVLRKEEAQIECPYFGDDCLANNEYDDDGSVLSYQWMSKFVAAVDMCTISRCSFHLFVNEEKLWVPTINVTRPPSGNMIFTSLDDQQKMVLVNTKSSRDQQYHNLTIQTWSNQDFWSDPWNQTILMNQYKMLPQHYLSIQSPQLSKDGTVLCVVVVDGFVDRPIVNEVLTTALLFHWEDKENTHEWVLHQTVRLGDNVRQVEMSGNGQRMLLFQTDFFFRAIDLV